MPPLEAELPRRTASAWQWRDALVYIERVGDPDASIRMILIHGAGGNSAATWHLAAHFALLGAYVGVRVPPGYGQTPMADPARLIVSCLLEPHEPAVRIQLVRHPALKRVAGPVLRMMIGPLANTLLPIRWIADMHKIANDALLVSEVLAGKRGGGGRFPVGWMRTFLNSSPLLEPEDFVSTPVVMVHPADDRWTPLEISRSFFDRIAAPKELVVLENCGHFPVEEPGFTQLDDTVRRVLADVQPPQA